MRLGSRWCKICTMITVKSFAGTIAENHIHELARLRIQVFRDYPYLYDGSIEYELDYLKTYSCSSDSIIVIAFDNDKVIGASTGIPIEAETENIKAPWIARGYNIHKIFYFGESVLDKAYRGRGIGVRFFEHREHWAKSLRRFDRTTFCGVVRPDNHPLRPDNFTPLDNFWRNRGYQKTEDLVCNISWKDINEAHETPKPLHFWYKSLD